MYVQILVAIALGVMAGVTTGLIPGIHINLISIILLSISPFLLQKTSVIVLCVFIIAMSVTHTFLDSIPSIFLGAPDADQVMSVLPGHKLLLQGKGFEAVKLTVIGSLLCLLIAAGLIPILIKFFELVYPVLKQYIGFILIGVVIFMILKDKKKEKIFWNFIVFSLCGIFGLLCLNLNVDNVLFPMLSGLFGISMLVLSISDKVNIPKQSFKETINVEKKTILQAVFAGSFAGTLTSFFPGLGPAQGAVIASQMTKKIGDYGFMILVGGINTVNFVLSLVTLFIIEKARNGAVIVISKLANIELSVFLIFVIAAIITGGIATILALKISKGFARIITKLDYNTVAIAVICLITVLVFYFSNWLGLLILFISVMIGFLPPLLNVPRNHAMGCLLLPVILWLV